MPQRRQRVALASSIKTRGGESIGLAEHEIERRP
jgi:hypothetical protein